MRHKSSFTVLSALCLLIVCASTDAAPHPKRHTAFTDPEQAGSDFQIQGEYVGEVISQEGKSNLGVQVIALADGQFSAVALPGGLPGAGWDETNKQVFDGKTENSRTTLKAESGKKLIIADGAMQVFDAQENSIGTLKKVHRESPTLGKKPPKGAVVLFDGTSPEHFNKSIRRTPKHELMTEDGLLREGVDSKRRFQSFSIHAEFRTPFMPYARGQGRGNSGFYAQGRYEVQILDSFGLEPQSGYCGGIYSVAPARINMCLPPLSWQTYDVEFTAAKFDDAGKKLENARMTVRHNGVIVHDNVELPKATPSCIEEESSRPGPIHFQNHGNPVRFRNVWLIEKK